MIYLKFIGTSGKEERILINKAITTAYKIDERSVEIFFSKVPDGKKTDKAVEWSFCCERKRINNLMEIELFLDGQVKKMLNEKQEVKQVVNKIIKKQSNEGQASLEL